MDYQSKHLAGISLGVMGMGFLATLPLSSTIGMGILQGGFEAGLVGGLADWFAVTALFRHPLGLAIPHTALLPKNRKKITEAIVSTLENEWLSKESITEKIHKISLTEKITNVIESELQSGNTKDGISLFLKEMLNHIDLDQVSTLLSAEIKKLIFNLDIQYILKELVEKISHNQIDKKSFDFLLGKLKAWVEKEESSQKLGAMLAKALSHIELEGLMQFALNSLLNMVSEEKLGNIISNVILRAVANLQMDDNPFRRDIVSLFQAELRNLSNNQKVIEEIERWREQWISDEILTQTTKRLLTNLKQNWVQFLEHTINMDLHIVPYILRIMENIKANTQFISRLDMWLKNKIVQFINENHSKIGNIVRENLNKLDDETLTQMIEDKIGRDLQWIRVNGAICGFTIGIILSVIKLFV